MNYRIMIVAMILGLAGNAWAADNDAASKDAMSDDRVECIEAAVAEEFEDKKLQDQFIETCVQEKMAGNDKPAAKKDSDS